MKRTNELKTLITSLLGSIDLIKEVYFEVADKDKIYPHVVYSVKSVGLDIDRDDYLVDIDVWDKGTLTATVDDICDDIEDLFNCKNEPQSGILPTFYLDRRINVEDPDKTIRHRLITVQVQNYCKGE